MKNLWFKSHGKHFIMQMSDASKVNGWASSHEKEGILRNIPCHIMEYSKYIILPRGINVWHGKIFHTLSWNIFLCHMWFVGGISNDLVTLNILSFLVQPMLQIFLSFYRMTSILLKLLKWQKTTWLRIIWWIQTNKYIDSSTNMCYDGNKIRQYTWKHIMTINGFIANKMYKVLSSHILWCHTINV